MIPARPPALETRVPCCDREQWWLTVTARVRKQGSKASSWTMCEELWSDRTQEL